MDLQQRSSGILLPIFSLPGTRYVGALGDAARRFADFLAASGQSWWQLLPVNPIDMCFSPYSSSSAFAGEPLYLDLAELARQGLLDDDDLKRAWYPSRKSPEETCARIDYASAFELRRPCRRKAFERYRSGRGGEKYRQAEREFRDRNALWLDDYCLYMALADEFEGKAWNRWPEPFRHWSRYAAGRSLNDALREATRERPGLAARILERVAYYGFLQLVFETQWRQFKRYCNDRGVHLLGDVPIYVCMDGAETWAHPELFQLDENDRMSRIAGVPGDGFNSDCQKWDSPLYDWPEHERTGFHWWLERIGHTMNWFDALRLDHFIGFYNYYSFPAACNADTKTDGKTVGETVGETVDETVGASGQKAGGVDGGVDVAPNKTEEIVPVDSDDPAARVYAAGWRPGPQEKLFDVLFERFPRERFIAEDLGVMNNGVHRLRNHYSLPGMNVLQFSFDGCDGSDPSAKWTANSVACTGTHDTPTVLDWLDSLEKLGPYHQSPNFAKVWFVLSKYQRDDEKITMDFSADPDGFLPEYDFWRYTNVPDDVREARMRELPHIPASDVEVRPDVVALVKPAVRAVMHSACNTALFPMQDILGLGASSRTNMPGTDRGNWRWRLEEGRATDDLARRLRELVRSARRLYLSDVPLSRASSSDTGEDLGAGGTVLSECAK